MQLVFYLYKFNTSCMHWKIRCDEKSYKILKFWMQHREGREIKDGIFSESKDGKKITIELKTKSVRENARLLVPPASRFRHRPEASRIPRREETRRRSYEEGEAMHEHQQQQQRLQESRVWGQDQDGTKPEGPKYEISNGMNSAGARRPTTHVSGIR